MKRRRFSQTMASEWQTAFVVSHKMPCCALLTAIKNYNKSLEKKTARLFLQDRDQDKDLMIQDQDFHFCPRGASRPRPCFSSRFPLINGLDSRGPSTQDDDNISVKDNVCQALRLVLIFKILMTAYLTT